MFLQTLFATYSRRKNRLLISRVLFTLLVAASQPVLTLENLNNNKYAKILLGLPLRKTLRSKFDDMKIIKTKWT